MAKDNKMQLPTGQGGIVRYFDDYHSKIEFKPGHVVLMAAVVLIIELVLHSR